MAKQRSSQRKRNDSVYFVKSAERPLTRPADLSRDTSGAKRTTNAISGRFQPKNTTDTVTARQVQARFVAAIHQHRNEK